MYFLLFAFLLLLFFYITSVQGVATMYFNPEPSGVPSRLAPHVQYAHLAARSVPTRLKIFYSGTPPNSATQTAIAFAATLLDSFFLFKHDINVVVQWTDLSAIPNLLGSAGPTQVCAHPDSTNFRYVIIPTSLYSELTDGSFCPDASSSMHVSIQMNSHPPSAWYTGTDGNPPSNQIDLITVMMHEMVHGLGFFSGMLNGNGNYAYAPYGTLYDWFIFEGKFGWPVHYGLPVSNPAIVIPSILTNGLQSFKGDIGASSAATFLVYTPNPFQPGSSISHVAPSSSTTNRLMFPSISPGEAHHDIGGNVWAVMANLGYSTVANAQYATSTTGVATCLPTCEATSLNLFIDFIF